MSRKTAKTKETPLSPEIDDLFRRMADEAPGILSVRSVRRDGGARMRHEIAGRRGRRPYLERQDFTLRPVRIGVGEEPTFMLFEVSVAGDRPVLMTGVASAVLAVVRR